MKKQVLFIALTLLMTFQIKAQCWVSIATRFHTSYGIKSDGTLWAWGYSSNGQIGNGTYLDQSTPVQIGTDSDWISIHSGGTSVFANKSDGTMWGWGRNDHGELGDGTNVEKVVPTLIGTFNYTSFTSGSNHCLAVKSNGTLWSWGFNSYGELGTGGNSTNIPVQVGSATNWVSVYAGEKTSFGIKTDGTLWAWGRNQNGQLGNGNAVNQLIPIQIGSATDWESVSPGWNFTIARKTDGTLWTWGLNDFGQFGNGNLLNSLVPIQSGTATDWASVSIGIWHNIAIKNNGTLWAWGSNFSGQLGDGTNIDHTTPVQIGTATNWNSSSAGANHSLILNSNHELYASGYNIYGQVGIGTLVDVNTFTTLSGSAVTPQFTTIAPVCSGTSVTLPTTSTNGISGSWSPPFNSTASGTYTFTPTVGCATTTTLPITINQIPVILSSTPSTRCGTGTVVLGSSATAGVLNWYDQPTGGTLLGTGTSFTTPSISSSTTYYVEAVNGSCASARTAVTASVTTTITPSANTNQVFCTGEVIGDISITGTSINWYDASSAGNLLPIGTPLVNGTVYYASQTLAGCESSRIAVTAAVNTTSAPSGTANQNFCQAATIGDLGVTGTNIIWYNAATAGTILPANTPIVTGTIYYASQTQNSCESSARLAVTATVTTVAAPSGSNNQDFCSEAAISDLVVTGTNIIWYNAATAGTILPANTPIVTGTIYYASQTQNSCESSARLAVTATVTTVAAPSGSSNQDFCSGATISDLVVTGTNVIWYNAVTAGTILPANTVLIAGTVYYASQTVATCESSTRLAVTVTLDACLGIDDHSLEKIIMYPNPANNQLFIETSETINSTIVDVTGKVILFKILESGKNELDVSLLTNGVYYIRLESGSTLKFVKH